MNKPKLIGLKDIKFEIDNLQEYCNILLMGPRGTGKTSLAEYVASKRDREPIFIVAKTLKARDLLSILVNIREGDVLLIDEAHRLDPGVEELLYHPMEKYTLSIKDSSGRTQMLPLPKFSVVATTTKPSRISKPLMSRFQIHFQIPHYSLRELARIITLNYPQLTTRSALRIAINVTTPREALNLTYRVVSLISDKDINKRVPKTIEFIGYRFGLSRAERQYLQVVDTVKKISLSSLCSALQLDEEEIKFIEDKLHRKQLIDITSRGRSLTVYGMLLIKKIKGQ